LQDDEILYFALEVAERSAFAFHFLEEAVEVADECDLLLEDDALRFVEFASELACGLQSDPVCLL
jgi:hypothetical protein